MHPVAVHFVPMVIGSRSFTFLQADADMAVVIVVAV
jgi:hypothetical protein